MPEDSIPDSPQDFIVEVRKELASMGAKLDDAVTSVAEMAGGGARVETQTIEEAGYGAFTADDGRVRLTGGHVTHEVRLTDGRSERVDVKVPGLFEAVDAEDCGLSSSDRDAIRRVRHALGKVNVLAKLGVTAGSGQYLGELALAAKAAPAAVRPALLKLSEQVSGRFMGRASGFRDGAFATGHSTAQTSGNPGYNWVGDQILPGALDVTADLAGLYPRIATPIGGEASRHATAKTKLRVITSLGGFGKIGRQLSTTGSEYPSTQFDTDLVEANGQRAAWAASLDEVDLDDPRSAIDMVSAARTAAEKSYFVDLDLRAFFGQEESVASAHTFAAAGLQQIVADGRDSNFSGQPTDPMLIADGILAWAVDRSTRVDVIAGTSLSAAGDINDSRQNFLIGWNYIKNQLDAQYQDGGMGLAMFCSNRIADALLVVDAIGTFSAPLFRPATPEERAANPFFRGTLIDGTPVYASSLWGTNYSAAGVPTSGASLDVIGASYLPSVYDLRGAGDGRFRVERIPGTERVVASMLSNRQAWNPLPAAKKAHALGYNLDFDV